MNLISFLFNILIHQFILKKVKNEFKKQSTLAYLKAIQITRKGIAATILFFITLQILVLSLMGTLVTGILILPIETEDRIRILFFVLLGLFLLLLIGLKILLSEKTWFKASGAEQMLNEIK